LKQLTVLSGKGGTPQIQETHEFKGSRVAVIDQARCSSCNACEKACRFEAIKEYEADPVLCEGCGVCAYVCPEDAIELKERISGYAYISETRYGPMSHARLNPGAENSGKLVTVVRQHAHQIAEREGSELILNDGPPGIGCPVIASVGGVDMGLIVVEPTLSGIHDMERALALLNHFQIPATVCINKYDINLKNTTGIDEYCTSNGIIVVGKIPFDIRVTQAMVAGKPVVEYAPDCSVSVAILKLWNCLLNHLTLTP
jgi:MinD superfamily P-loop ATPase